MARVNIAWILCKQGVAAPIVVGTTNMDNSKDTVAGVKLTKEELKCLEEPSNVSYPPRTC